MEERRDLELFPGVRLHMYRTEQFHTSYFSASLLRQLSGETASRDSLLLPVLYRGTRSCPDRRTLSEALEARFGTQLSPVTTQFGEVLARGFQAVFPDDRYLPGEERLLEQTVGLVGELLLDPATRGGLLKEDFVRSERQNLSERIEAVVNNKQRCAALRARALMFAGEPYGIYPLGTAAEARKQGYVALTRHYRSILGTAPLELSYCGSGDFARVEAAVRAAFRTLPAGEREQPEQLLPAKPPEYLHACETMQVEQGNLVIGFRIGGRDRLDNVTLAVLNELLGSGAGSALFRHVREERSLCYSIGSSTDRYKRCLFVQAGIDWDKAEEVEAAVLQEVDDLVNGAFTGEALEIARRGVYSGYRMGMDDPGSICAFGLGQELAGRRGSLRQSAALALEVTAEAVMELAARLQPALCYLLRGEARV